MAEYLNLFSEEDTETLAKTIAKQMTIGNVLALYGELGAGKTFFTQLLCKALGVQESVTSPSYVLMNEYEGIVSIAHLDLYRLNSEDEVLELGLGDLFEDRLTIIEWPEIAERVLPSNTIKVFFELKNDYRKVRIESKKPLLI